MRRTGTVFIQGEIEHLQELFAAGRYAEAESLARQFTERWPSHAFGWKTLGAILAISRRLDDALPCLQRSVTLWPTDAEGHDNLGMAMNELGRFSEAETSFRRALELSPDRHATHLNLGNVLFQVGRLNEAEASFRRALDLKPDYHDAIYNLGNVRLRQGRLPEAQSLYHDALRINPGLHLAHLNLGNVFKDFGRFRQAEESYRQALKVRPDFYMAYSNLLFMLNYDADRSAEDIFSEYRRFDTSFGDPLRAQWREHDNDRGLERRLRIGYVSPDFRKHSLRHFIEPLLAHHNKQDFEIYAYADLKMPDEVSARMQSYVEHWILTSSMSDEQLADRIRTDRVDVLVDLAGHTVGNRLLVFARKPAPVSVSMLGFGYTTGLSAIDWFLTDELITPKGCEHVFSERPWRIAQALAYRPAEGMGQVSGLPTFTRGRVTFGSLSRSLRINKRVIHAWASILHRVHGAVLRIDSYDFRAASLCNQLAAQFAELGIHRERLQIGYESPASDVLRQIDVVLDSFPHNSGTTLFESLYMGVPVITLAARPPVGRLAASILTNIGYPEWVATNEGEYVEKAVALTTDLPRLAETRLRLRTELERSPLMDEAGYARRVELAYREMWRHRAEERRSAQSGE